MSLRDTLRGALATPVQRIISDVGDTQVRVYRRLEAEHVMSDDGADITPWLMMHASIPVLLTEVTRAQAQRLWGAETKSSVRVLAAESYGLRNGDGLVVLAGFRAGFRFYVSEARVVDAAALTSGALEETAEDFSGA